MSNDEKALLFFKDAAENGAMLTKDYMKIAVNAIGRDIAKRPIYDNYSCSCPNCGNTEISMNVYCNQCGQRLG